MQIQLHPKQAEFLDSRALFRGFTGGRGSGKSFCGAYDLLKRAKPNRLYMATAPTYTMLRDATLRTFLDMARRFNYLRKWSETKKEATLGNGAEVLFRSMDEPERARGPNLSGAWMDEGSLNPKDAFDITIACLREGQEQGWLSCTFTPKGRLHWTYELFGKADNPDVALFKASTRENPFNPPEFYATLKRQYGSVQAAQELEGEFVEGAGYLFKRDWFKVVEGVPAGTIRVRYWDLAATAQKDNNDPDYTVGVLMGRADDGRLFIIDVRRVRTTPASVERLIRATAEQDGHDVPIVIEQEPGSSGVALIDHYRRHVLQGFVFEGERATGDKSTRAQALSGQAEHGNVYLLRGPFLKDFLDEAEMFPEGRHDDQIDAASGALRWVSASAFNQYTEPETEYLRL